MIFRVTDLHVSSLTDRHYDLLILASGYEERCRNIAELLEPSNISSTLILGFEEHVDAGHREYNRNFLAKKFGCNEHILSFDSEEAIFKLLSSANLPRDRVASVLIDYSSMSRMWYNSIIEFFNFGFDGQGARLTMGYTVGKYIDVPPIDNLKEADFAVEDVLCLPSLEGGGVRTRKSVALVGLGFEWVPPFGVVEALEPDTVYGFIAEPGAFPEYPGVAEARNETFINEYCRERLLRLPLRSVEAAYKGLGGVVAPHLGAANIIIVPMGPKPHVLASIVVASRFREVTCLYAKGTRHRPPEVKAASPMDIVVTCIEIETQNAHDGR